VSVHDSAPLWDALTTVMSLVAQYLLTKKILENWFVWISADVVYIALYLYKELSLTAILYFIFMVMCVIGVKEWRATLLKLSSRVSSQQELPA
jgi:nicotinamide mononucleotide transporter